MESTDNSSLRADIRVLNELLRLFRATTEKELGRIQELQNSVTVIGTRCEDKTCVYDKTFEKHENVKELISGLDSRLGYLERGHGELENLLNKVREAEQKRLNDALSKTENTLENTRNKAYYMIWKIIPIVISVVSVVVSLFW